ncbi:CvpA family protein [bacterium endosymbiont of Pedicinus badii]|uniref:CvpA family protein n=1 Tax=bacterium endosymbiont of Pedicinus badii TaxID=1719126 RepID=UPI0009BC06C1|nr:CvpA family protein [bacterium endosymbiont of Pedicinus badii]OQM34461.1 hypothetical protein AOQ89_01050 [bacterium endosymbiont of Pedicinus badii]
MIQYAVFFIFFISSLMGLHKGFIREIFSLLIWYFFIIFLLSNYQEINKFFFSNAKNSIQKYINFAIFAFFILIINRIINYSFYLFILKFGYSFIDKILGLFLGIFRGLVLSYIFVFFLNKKLSINLKNNWIQKIIQNSYLKKVLDTIINKIKKFF